MRLESLDIALFYEHPDAGTWSLLDLREHRGVIHPDDLEPEAFLKASGAINMYCDRFKRFLHTGAAGDMRSYVNFLIESLISPADRHLAARFPGISVGDPFFDYERVAAGLFQEDQTILLLQDRGHEFELSYLDPNGDAPEHRLSPYFRNVRIHKQIWRLAAAEALDEYFSVAEERLRSGTSAILQPFIASWRSYRHMLG